MQQILKIDYKENVTNAIAEKFFTDKKELIDSTIKELIKKQNALLRQERDKPLRGDVDQLITRLCRELINYITTLTMIDNFWQDKIIILPNNLSGIQNL